MKNKYSYVHTVEYFWKIKQQIIEYAMTTMNFKIIMKNHLSGFKLKSKKITAIIPEEYILYNCIYRKLQKITTNLQWQKLYQWYCRRRE